MDQSYPFATFATPPTAGSDRCSYTCATPIRATVTDGPAAEGNVARVTTLRLRPEDPADAGPVRRVLAAAFARPDVATPPEVVLVDELRGTPAWLPQLAMVAEYGGEVVGYALLTRVRVRPERGSDVPVLALGPVAVAPHRQRVGHGTAVVQAALDASTELGERLVVVLGDPAFYRRFGFSPATELGLTGPWAGLGEPWQALVLPPSTSEEGPRPAARCSFRRPGRRSDPVAPLGGQAGWVRRYLPKCGTVKATVPRSPE